jgi:hypothetical protein
LIEKNNRRMLANLDAEEWTPGAEDWFWLSAA